MTSSDTTPIPESSRPHRTWKQSITLALFAVSALLAAVLVYDRFSNPLSLYGSAYPPDTVAPNLVGVGEDGRPLALSDLRSKTVAVFFGFLNCPNFCPTTLAALERVWQALPVQQRQNFVPLLVSVDPKRDTVSKLNEYVKYFNPQAKGMIIPEPQLSEAAKAWGVGYQYVDVKGLQDYQVNHTTGTYLVDREGKRRLVWDYTQVTSNPERLAQDVLAVMK